jgi:hypothetical protein
MSFPPGTEMFQFPGFASHAYEFSMRYPRGWVAPFGYPWIKAYSQLPMAFRSVPRPSSPPGAKASTECPLFARDRNANPPCPQPAIPEDEQANHSKSRSPLQGINGTIHQSRTRSIRILSQRSERSHPILFQTVLPVRVRHPQNECGSGSRPIHAPRSAPKPIHLDKDQTLIGTMPAGIGQTLSSNRDDRSSRPGHRPGPARGPPGTRGPRPKVPDPRPRPLRSK